MIYAIATDGSIVAEHFGRCPSYTLVDIQNGTVIEQKTVDNPGHAPGAIPKFLDSLGAKYIICGGMGPRAAGFFDQLGIQKVTGISDTVDGVIGQLLSGTLQGGESFCKPGAGKGYGIDKEECDHTDE